MIATMDFNDIPLFVRVVEAGSFTAVANEEGLQRSSVSRSMSRLERSVGVRLLQRTTRQIALTDAGRVFYEDVRGAISKVDDALNVARELGTEPRGTVRVSSLPDTQNFNLPEMVVEFTRRYPSIRVELVLTARTVAR
jgi:DNA-binding transcriptional LysR family regulator